MLFLLKGIILGLLLAIMVGPLTISLLYTSVEKGVKSGLMIAYGIWFSDLLFILSCFLGFKYVEQIVELPNFELITGGIGSAVLVFLGLGMVLKKNVLVYEDHLKKKNIPGFLWQGFAINTFNPFTFFFWISVIGASRTSGDLVGKNAFFFFLGIMLVIVVSDGLKVFLATKLRRWLTPKRMVIIRKISGIALIAFGVVLLLRVII